MKARAIGALVLLFAAGCTAIVAPPTTYRACVPHDVELFEANGTFAELQPRCWSLDQAPPPTRILTSDNDLVIRPPQNARWSESTSAPILFRQMHGDFVVVTRAEAVSTAQGDHCLFNDESAGLVVRREGAWSTLSVRPFFGDRNPDETCRDEAANPLRATVRARSFGFPAPADASRDGVGADAEAFIAICRFNDQLLYYYREQDPESDVPGPWTVITQHSATSDVLDVGLTASGSTTSVKDPGLEGHFAWIVFHEYGTLPGDGCEEILRRFTDPEPP